jgi:O-antigen ligase
MLNFIIATLIICLMILFRAKLPHLLGISLFIFATTFALFWQRLGFPFLLYSRIFEFYRWAFYFGCIILGVIYSQKKHIRRIIPADIFIFFFLMLLPLSVMVSIRPALTFKRGITVGLMYLGLFFGVYSYLDDRDKIYRICYAMLIALLAYNILSCIPGIGLSIKHGRMSGLSGHATGTAALNMFIFPIALMVYTLKRSKINLAIVLFIAIFTYLTYTRTGIIAMILGTIFFYSQYFHRRRVIFVFIALLILITLFFSFFSFGIWLPERLVRLENLPILGGRIVAWGAAREIILQRPLYGYGFGTESLLFREFGIHLREHAGGYFHNSFLGLAAQIGIPFALLFFSGLILFTISIVNYVARIEDNYLSLIGITLSTILFVGFIYCFAESWIYSMGSYLAFIYFLTVVLSIRFKALTHEQL